MNNPTSKPSQTSLFQVYLRLRPPISQHKDGEPERCLTVDPPEHHESTGEEGQEGPTPVATHITLQPPADSRKRAIERFGFTKVFDEAAVQLDVFQDTGMEDTIRGVLLEGRDGLVATLGVTGSGKSHTILGSKTQRGLTQMALDVIFQSLEPTIKPPDNSINPILLASVAASDPCEAQFFSAQTFLEAVYGDQNADRGRNSRAQTPVSSSRANTPSMVRNPLPPKSTQIGPAARPSIFERLYPMFTLSPVSPLRFSKIPSLNTTRVDSKIIAPKERFKHLLPGSPSHAHPKMAENNFAKSRLDFSKDPVPALIFPRRQMPQRPSVCVLPRLPDVSHLALELNPKSEYMILVSMYEVYNDRIFDLLSPAIVPGQGSTMSRQGNNQKDRRRPLMFKYTEASPDRKVVAGLRKIACSTYEEALAILDVGLTERKVSGTGANSVSSRSHGFFCLEVKRRMRNKRTGEETWVGNTLSVADLAGSERARTAKTAGATLAEAGKINESLMYLGQCLQMQSSIQDGNKTALVPFRQCKLTELLFSNSFPSAQSSNNRPPQRATMIVTADALGDYNATSQILRYSALARDVAVPRAPSATESILSGTMRSPRVSDNAQASNEELENAVAEIERLTSENENLAVRLADEEAARAELEMRLTSSEERCLMIEQDVREECWAEMEEQMEEERKRWQSAWDDQVGHNDEHVDKKIELISRGFHISEDPQPSSDEKYQDLEFENDQLRSKVIALERELNCQSPSRKPRTRNALEPTHNSNLLGRESDIESALLRMDQLKLTDNMFPSHPVTSTASPGKKHRKMATRKWDLAPEDEI